MATSGGALSSVGRASRLHREGRRFEPVSAHHEPSFRSRVGASDPSSRERTFHADQTRWLVPLRRGSLFGTQPYAGSVPALLLFDLSQTAGRRGLCDQPRRRREVAYDRGRRASGPLSRADRGCGTSDMQAVERRTRSEEHTSELQSLMRISYAVFCLKKKYYRNVTDMTYIYLLIYVLLSIF